MLGSSAVSAETHKDCQPHPRECQTRISADQAKSIALKDCGYDASYFKSVKVDEDQVNDQFVYKIEFKGSHSEYDYVISGHNGSIIEKDSDDAEKDDQHKCQTDSATSTEAATSAETQASTQASTGTSNAASSEAATDSNSNSCVTTEAATSAETQASTEASTVSNVTTEADTNSNVHAGSDSNSAEHSEDHQNQDCDDDEEDHDEDHNNQKHHDDDDDDEDLNDEYE